jgi:hypothetical protein
LSGCAKVLLGHAGRIVAYHASSGFLHRFALGFFIGLFIIFVLMLSGGGK